MEKEESIVIKNAYTNNLKNLDLEIPLFSLTCVTGVSGCGKSSLVFDTIYAESQRNLLESMGGNLYGQKIMEKPKVDLIENLRAALTVSQSYYNVNPRSTVGTITELSYFIRSLFSLIENYENSTDINESFFSPNNPSSFCENCKGTGEELDLEEEKIILDKNKTLKEGAILYLKGSSTSLEYKTLVGICEYYSIDINKKFKDLTEQEKNNLLHRKEEITINVRYKTSKGRYRQKNIKIKGVFEEIRDKLKEIDKPSTLKSIEKYLHNVECHICKGSRLSKEVLNIKVCKKNISEVENMNLYDLKNFLKKIEEKNIKSNAYFQIKQLINQMIIKIDNLIELNLEYLDLRRKVPSLSGGEIQRVRIANQLNCALKDLIYIFDEPCKGLHPYNLNSIIYATRKLVNNGNTVIAIEHNNFFISNSDLQIELGPIGGINGGNIVFQKKDFEKYEPQVNFNNKMEYKSFIELKKINFRNIKNQNIKIPIGGITFITGGSGSGKSTLAKVIYESLKGSRPYFCKEIKGNEEIKNVYHVNQLPIGKNPRSLVVSYLEIYEDIRKLFGESKKAKDCNLNNSDFSINVKGGRCEECQGTGLKKIELNHLPDTYLLCPQCNGKRFNNEVLCVKYNNKNISEVLETPIEELIEIFKNNEKIYNKFESMIKIGLGYIKLGQLSMTLSGGEAQRIKLSKYLGLNPKGKSVFIFDEPTSGLNKKDIEKFEKIILELQSKGNTIIMIEHNIEFITKIGNYIIDFGINGGEKGGKVLYDGILDENIFEENTSWKIKI